jgi:hypothetical protein
VVRRFRAQPTARTDAGDPHGSPAFVVCAVVHPAPLPSSDQADRWSTANGTHPMNRGVGVAP